MKQIMMILFLVAIWALPAQGWKNSDEYTIVRVKDGTVHTSCVKDPRIITGAKITLFKFGVAKWVGKVENTAGGGRFCKQYRLSDAELEDGLYIGIWDWDLTRTPFPENNKKLSSSERNAQILNIHDIVSKSPHFKASYRLGAALGFIHRDKILGIAQYLYENPATEETEIAIYKIEIAPVPMVRRADFFSGAQGAIPLDFTFDILDYDNNGNPELVILSGAPIPDNDVYIGELRILKGDENGDFTTDKTQNFLF